jgi:hypothetical protein
MEYHGTKIEIRICKDGRELYSIKSPANGTLRLFPKTEKGKQMMEHYIDNAADMDLRARMMAADIW